MQTQTMLALVRSQTKLVVEEEYRFHPVRRWRFDIAIPSLKVALEIEGGAWTGGRHNSPTGFLADIEKYNEASLLGWRVFRCTPQQVTRGEAADLLLRAIEASKSVWWRAMEEKAALGPEQARLIEPIARRTPEEMKQGVSLAAQRFLSDKHRR